MIYFQTEDKAVFAQRLRQPDPRLTSSGPRPQPVLAAKFDSVAVMEKSRAAQRSLFDDLNYPNKKQYLAFPSYTCMSSFAERRGCKRILEIGSGLSTAVWARFAKENDAKICSIDANLERTRSFIRDTPHEALVSKHVELIEGVSIRSDEFIDFYTGEAQTSYGGVEIAAFRDHINEFQSQNCSIKRRYKVSRVAGHSGWTARDLMTSESSLFLPRRLLDMFSSNGNFANEIAFLQDAKSRGVAGVIADLSKNESPWDFIFFDSGELASMIEWTKLKGNIAVGGFAAFHDIYFPKSLKNIIPCAAIMADPDWEVVFCDDSTKQGVLIAERLQ